jgi:hypothetical protein
MLEFQGSESLMGAVTDARILITAPESSYDDYVALTSYPGLRPFFSSPPADSHELRLEIMICSPRSWAAALVSDQTGGPFAQGMARAGTRFELMNAWVGCQLPDQ